MLGLKHRAVFPYLLTLFVFMAPYDASQVRWLDAFFPPESWVPMAGHVLFVVDKVALGQIFLQVLHFSPTIHNSANILLLLRCAIGLTS
jgi:hypothetical protein